MRANKMAYRVMVRDGDEYFGYGWHETRRKAKKHANQLKWSTAVFAGENVLVIDYRDPGCPFPIFTRVT